MTRRELLQIGAAGLVSPMLPRWQEPEARNEAQVIIIGAGLAGLSAGRALKDAGLTAIILEARERVGGRVATNRTFGTPVEMGLGRLSAGEGSTLTELAGNYNLATQPYKRPALTLYGPTGKALAAESLASAEALAQGFIQKLRERRTEALPHETLASVVQEVLQGAPPELKDAARWIVAADIELREGLPFGGLGLARWRLDVESEVPEVLSTAGLDGIPKGLAAGQDVRLKEIVRAIEYDENGVTVRTISGVYRGKRAIVTLPLGVLKTDAIAFSPELPDEKKEAISQVGLASLGRIALRFGERFWPKELERFGLVTADGSPVEFVSLPGTVPILIATASGPQMQKFEATPKTGVQACLTQLRTMFGAAVPNPTGTLVTQWSVDPYAKGAFHVPVPSELAENISDLASPVDGKLFFAGEATEDSASQSALGAISSGKRAAQEVRDSMNAHSA